MNLFVMAMIENPASWLCMVRILKNFGSFASR
jgi:hypothetical protein